MKTLLEKIGNIKILDPACGCGNFLIISYRELRRLQITIHKQIRKLEGRSAQTVLDIQFDKDLNVDSMFGIEILEFPARIAQVGLWLIDHLVNMELSKEFGLYYKRLPLKKTANIIIQNSLRINWEDYIPLKRINYIIGNPPFISKQDRNIEQQEDMQIICGKIENHGLLDYVACWYVKATEYIKDTNIQVAFVSTNSITQGEQVGILGDYLTNEKHIKINFAHRTFRWSSDAKGKAHVFVVIIGFAFDEPRGKYIYDYEKPDSEPVKIKANHINFYLIDQEDIYIFNRSKPLCKVPQITFGSMPNDDGNFLFNDDEKNEFLKQEPGAKKFIKPFISAKEFLHNEKRWCLWLKDAEPSELKKLEKVQDKIKKVKIYRLNSNRKTTIELANTPYLFGEIRQPSTKYILIPLHSSENRTYIPIAFLTPENIANNSCSIIEKASLYHFGILTSSMHMNWVKQICGRIKSDYRYSNKLVYNNFPWPEDPSIKDVAKIEEKTKEILKIRLEYKDSSLADLYNPIFIPKKLLNAHKKLDKAIDNSYRKKPFKTNLEKLAFLFDLYKKYSSQN